MANLVEVFSSVQGEGPDVGRSTLFVRFGECDLRCRWCDSPATWRPARACRVELERGSGRFEERPNPVSTEELTEICRQLLVESHQMVSLTGGEPLLQPEAVAELGTALGALGPSVLLETHGIHRDALLKGIDALDVISMDWKLASDVRRVGDPIRGPVAPFHDAHEAFLEVARAASRVIVKLVITLDSLDEEIDEAVARVARVHPGATLVLQPVTPFGAVRERPPAERMLSLVARAERVLSDVRVIPQTHPMYGAP